MGDTVKVGIISANWGVTAHLPAWRSVPGVEVVAICTAHQETAEAAAKANGIPRAFWDYREMAASPDIDIMDVGTRPALRRDMCLVAFENGKHVYNGLPFAASLADAAALRDAHAASGKVGMVDAYSEYLPPFRYAAEVIESGVLGTVQMVQFRLELPIFSAPVSTFPYNWFSDASHGCSAARNLGSHALHLLVRMLGPVEQVAAQIERYVPTWHFVDGGSLDTEVADTAAMVLRFERGPIGVLTTAWASAGSPGTVLDISGTKGRLVVECPGMPGGAASIELHTTPGLMQTAVERPEIPKHILETPRLTLEIPWEAGPVRAMAVAFDEMAQAVRNGGAPDPGFPRAYHVQAVIEAAYRSAASGTWERCDLDPVTSA